MGNSSAEPKLPLWVKKLNIVDIMNRIMEYLSRIQGFTFKNLDNLRGDIVKMIKSIILLLDKKQ